MLLVVALMLLPGCATTHEYGPYMGKVVDKESGEPIEGAVVFAMFYTIFGFSPGGAVSHYADAMEVLTDNKGEFSLPTHRIFTFRIGDLWDDKIHAIIFKPGYGADPGRGSDIENNPSQRLRPNVFEIVRLPKLKTREERITNLSNVVRYPMDDVPCKKQRHILRLYNLEDKYLGFEGRTKPSTCGDSYE